MERVADTSGSDTKSCKKIGPTGPRGPRGPQGISGQPLNQYASFFMTQSSGGNLLPGQNFLFNNQVALSGIDYDSSTGSLYLWPRNLFRHLFLSTFYYRAEFICERRTHFQFPDRRKLHNFYRNRACQHPCLASDGFKVICSSTSRSFYCLNSPFPH